MLVRFDPFQPMAPAARSIPMSAVRRGDTFHVWFDLPGLAADQVDVTVEDRWLTVSAERPWHPQDGEQWLAVERPVGTFRRRLRLGDDLDVERLEAGLTDGVLEIRIPVAEAAKPRKIHLGGAAATNGHRTAIDATSG